MGYDQRQLNNGEQGEGSGLNADKVDNSEGSELGNTIDDSSITENSQGQIQADPSIRGIGWEKIAESSGISPVSISGLNGYNNYKVVVTVEGQVTDEFPDAVVEVDGKESFYTNYAEDNAEETGLGGIKLAGQLEDGTVTDAIATFTRRGGTLFSIVEATAGTIPPIRGINTSMNDSSNTITSLTFKSSSSTSVLYSNIEVYAK